LLESEAENSEAWGSSHVVEAEVWVLSALSTLRVGKQKHEAMSEEREAYCTHIHKRTQGTRSIDSRQRLVRYLPIIECPLIIAVMMGI
jgi:hypothetical protein